MKFLFTAPYKERLLPLYGAVNIGEVGMLLYKKIIPACTHCMQE